MAGIQQSAEHRQEREPAVTLRLRWSGCVSNGSRLEIVRTLTLRVLSIAHCNVDVGNTLMARYTIKVISTGALGLALSATSIVPPPQSAAAAELTQQHFDDQIKVLLGAVAIEMGARLKDNNRALADEIAAAIVRQQQLQQQRPGRVTTPVAPRSHLPTLRVELVERRHRVSHQPHWWYRPPPPPCPPEWGWYY
jgi:hypothetical protein